MKQLMHAIVPISLKCQKYENDCFKLGLSRGIAELLSQALPLLETSFWGRSSGNSPNLIGSDMRRLLKSRDPTSYPRANGWEPSPHSARSQVNAKWMAALPLWHPSRRCLCVGSSRLSLARICLLGLRTSGEGVRCPTSCGAGPWASSYDGKQSFRRPRSVS